VECVFKTVYKMYVFLYISNREPSISKITRHSLSQMTPVMRKRLTCGSAALKLLALPDTFTSLQHTLIANACKKSNLRLPSGPLLPQ
jgi:hypothetical protein